MKLPVKNNLILELHVPDFEVVKNFYAKLGFEVSLEDKPSDEAPGYLTMTRKDELGNTLLNFYGGNEKVYNQSFFKQFSQETKRGYAVGVTIPVKDIEDIYKLAQDELKSNVVAELKQFEDCGERWRDFRLVDPFGFYIRFTELVDWGQE